MYYTVTGNSAVITLDIVEEVTFDSMKEEETKKFLIDIDVSVQKIKECLNNNDGEAQSK